MKTKVLVAVLFASALAATRALAGPPFPEQCCACLPGLDHATTAGRQPVQALSCETILTAEERLVFDNQCADLMGDPICVAPVMDNNAQDDIDCTAILRTEGIICGVVAAPAPLLGTRSLAAVTIALAGVGVWMVRRRRASA